MTWVTSPTNLKSSSPFDGIMRISFSDQRTTEEQTTILIRLKIQIFAFKCRTFLVLILVLVLGPSTGPGPNRCPGPGIGPGPSPGPGPVLVPVLVPVLIPVPVPVLLPVLLSLCLFALLHLLPGRPEERSYTAWAPRGSCSCMSSSVPDERSYAGGGSSCLQEGVLQQLLCRPPLGHINLQQKVMWFSAF